jgi:AcrR family transcriptional regulator
MGISQRKERERAERRTLIMACAKELILERSADKVSMMDIAERAELSKATLYLYFPSKDVLFRDICEEAGDQFIVYFRSQMPPGGLSALESLKLCWECFLKMFGASDDMLIFFSMKRYLAPASPFIPLEEDQSPPGDSSYRFYDMIREMINQGQGEKFFEGSVDAGMVARTILTLFSYMVENTAKLPLELRRSRPIIEELRNILQIMLWGIAREGLNRALIILPKAEIRVEFLFPKSTGSPFSNIDK